MSPPRSIKLKPIYIYRERTESNTLILQNIILSSDERVWEARFMVRKKRQKDPFVCPKCGTRVTEPVKTWQLVSPMPDSKGRVTITVMGSFQCPNCGHKWRGVVSKLKVGGGEVEMEVGKKKKKMESTTEPQKEEGEVIELDIDEIDISEEEIEEALGSSD
ncbi:Chromatin protein Cren7 [Ignicoccus pacificus DSM 13166]|uniref:Chromatin protein Cren7 n=1 Tax=Ignicoccus pacificus DSM 13166 TaxID=940294 RepID=A0A977KAF5_9CREN|nr:Chromatin protein Cren7 [Ignicoccus pacificus DSM 13166]